MFLIITILILSTIIVLGFYLDFLNKINKKKSQSLNSNQNIYHKIKSIENNIILNTTKQEIIIDNSLGYNFNKINKKNIGICYKAARMHPLLSQEIVKYKTERFNEIFGKGKYGYFPGYGNLYNRVFDIWYEEVKSDDKKGIIEYRDISTFMRSSPHFADEITGGLLFLHELNRNKKGYSHLYKSDTKKQLTWYAGLKSIEFTGIIVCSENGWYPEK